MMSTHIRLVRAHAFKDAARCSLLTEWWHLLASLRLTSPSVCHLCQVAPCSQWHNLSGVGRIHQVFVFPLGRGWCQQGAAVVFSVPRVPKPKS